MEKTRDIWKGKKKIGIPLVMDYKIKKRMKTNFTEMLDYD